MPGGAVNQVSYSGDGSYLALAAAATPYIIIYKCDGDTITKLIDPSSIPAEAGQGIAFSTDGTYLAMACMNNSPYLWLYKRNGDNFTKMANPATLPSYGFSVAFSLDGTYLAFTQYVTVYKGGTLLGTFAIKSTNILTDLINATGIGYAAQNGVAGETKTVIKIWG